MLNLESSQKPPKAKRYRSDQPMPLLTLLLQKPQPLFSSKINLALFWSAKAGCTFAIKWFFDQAGCLDEAYQYHRWIHRYRQECFYKSPDYKLNLEKILDPNTNIVKVVRNPYGRAVSSYIHAVKYSYEHRKISEFLNRKVDSRNGFSFLEFLNYLESIDLSKCNGHHKQQLHPAEAAGLVKPNYIIHLENSQKMFQDLEIELALKKSEFQEIIKSKHHSLREENISFCGDFKFSGLPNQARKSFPKTRWFYNPDLQDKVFQLYRLDFEAYQYDPAAIPDH